MWTVILRFYVGTSRHAELLAFLARAKPCYERPGGIRVRLFQNLDLPEDFIEVVEYLDEGAYRRDQIRVAADPDMQALLQEWRGLHAGPLSANSYRELTIPPAEGG